MADQIINYEPAGPVCRAFMHSNAFVRLIIGPLGSGKTSAGIVEVLRRAQMQAPGPDGIRRVRVAIIRNTFAELKSTTIKSWEMWCPSQFGKLTMGGSPIVHHIQTRDLDMEVLFIPLDKPEDVRKLLSLEISFALIDEFREIDREVLDALTGRVGRYPSRMLGGCTWSGIMLISNPSDTESPMYELASNPPEGYEVFRQPSGLSAEAENLDNLPDGYYQRIAAGKDEEWKKVFIHGEFGFVIEGKPVYPSWRDTVHVPERRIEAMPGIGLTVGCDWGRTPAAAICQEWPNGQIVTLAEFVCDDSGIITFGQALTRFIKQHYPNNEVTTAVGDPSGTARQGDDQTVFDLMNQHTPWRWKPTTTNDPTLRIEAVSAALNRMVDGKPGFQLNPDCGTLRKGFAGGYHFKRVNSGRGATFDDKPNKNQYSHAADALQYAMLAMGGASAVLNRDPQRLANRSRTADGVDYDPLNPGSAPARQTGVVWGDGRPAPLDRNTRQPRSSMSRDADFNPFS